MKMNKYLSRGLVLTVIGILIGLFGSYMQVEEHNVYKWILVIAVIIFGIGFLTIVYSLIRKIERRSIVKDRTENQQESKANNKETDETA